MPDWMSMDEIQRDGVAFGRLIHVLLGVYVWEWFTSLGFDWSYVRGKRTFRWPLIFYFLNRYCLLIALIGIAVALNVTVEINCQALYTFNQVFGNASIGLASINLSLRTMAVWSQAWYIVVPLVLLIMGHWSLLLHGVLLKAEWVQGQCAITSTSNKMLAVSFIYTMVFDLTVLSLTAWKLVINAPSSKAMGRSKLVVLIFGDGLIYFIIAFIANLLATIFMLLNLNPVMSIVANVPAAVAATIVACRAVRRLAKFTHSGPEMFSSTQASTLAFRTHTNKSATYRPKVSTNGMGKNEGVHVQMETLESPTSPYVEYDAMGNLVTKASPSDDFDAEAQEIRHDFKRPPY
ncbi:hypothetical protein E1B28_006131 [Marasmius oreades]|uniref:Transmembrane protein n=1 Tax=Marasmius oreades TaxID=181124 RepID=A0A9P7UWB7_9AGAR|nr:uncharacterized protein E1B28_006131 [Marasmius oreades]KAG7095374.1 hypothetical protein E1B28_006131 [Marasmius oreades]